MSEAVMVRFIDTKEACRRLCCGRTFFYGHYLAKGIIKPVRRGRKVCFFVPQVEAAIKEEAERAGAV